MSHVSCVICSVVCRYVRNKKKSCAEVGFQSFGSDLAEDVSEAELLKVCVCGGGGMYRRPYYLK